MSPIPTSTLLVRGGVVALLASSATLLYQRWTHEPIFVPHPGSLIGRTIVITGGTAGLGLESAKRLAYGGANVVVTARSVEKGEKAVQAVQDYLKESNIPDKSKVSFKVVDLNNLASVKEAANWDDLEQIDVLMNNAGVMGLPELELTKDGLEKQIQSNHLGHFVLTAVLTPKFSDRARIISVSSEAYKFARQGILWEYVWTGSPDYGPWKSYAQSKLANILFTAELQRRIDDAGKSWKAVALHPGVVATNLGRNYFGENLWDRIQADRRTPQWSSHPFQELGVYFLKLGLNTPVQGATTQILLASGAEESPGLYYAKSKPQKVAEFATDPHAAKRFWKESEELSSVVFEISA